MASALWPADHSTLEVTYNLENRVLREPGLFCNMCILINSSPYRNGYFTVQEREWCWWVISLLWLQDTEVHCSTINSRRGPYHVTNTDMNSSSMIRYISTCEIASLKLVDSPPVFNLPIVNPAASKVLAKPTEGASPKRPASCTSNPAQLTCTIQRESLMHH